MLSITAYAISSKCRLVGDKDKIKLTWTAYKTEKKVAVNGSFNNIEVNLPKKEKTIDQLIYHTTFNIDLSSVKSGDSLRDKKISQFFFGKFTKGVVASGYFKKPKKGQVGLVLQMNGVKKTIPLDFTFSENKLVAKGGLNVLDFSASEALKQLAEACAVKHEGKTWPEVDVQFEAEFKLDCSK